MLKTKKTKLLIVLAIIISLLFPYATPVLAADGDNDAYQHLIADYGTTSTAEGDLTQTLFGGTSIQMVYLYDAASSNQLENEIYCLQEANEATPGGEYYFEKIIPDFANYSDTDEAIQNYINYIASKIAKAAGRSTANAADKTKAKENYFKIVWIAQNLYFTEKELFLDRVLENVDKTNAEQAKIISNNNETTGNGVKNIVTKADIKTMAQLAIWYYSDPDRFTIEIPSSGNTVVTKNTAYTLEATDNFGYNVKQNFDFASGSVFNTAYLINAKTTQWSQLKENYLEAILSYIIVNADKHNSSAEASVFAVPDFTNASKDAEAVIDGQNYKIGPYKIKGIKAKNTTNGIVVEDVNPNTITDSSVFNTAIKFKSGTTVKDSVTYNKIALANGTELTLDQAVKQGEEFYIYVSQDDVNNNNIDGFSFEINYLRPIATFLEVWADKNRPNEVQKVVEIARKIIPNQLRTLPIGKADLALRKFIVKKNGNDLENSREPIVDATGLVKDTNPDSTAKYKHRKDAVNVKVGDTLTYKIRVYNEGQVDATINKIVDIIPEGLDFDSASNPGWTYDASTRVATYTFTENNTLTKVNKNNVTRNKNTATGGLSTAEATIILTVNENATAKTLTNLAEIYNSNITDKDSGDITFVDEQGNKTDAIPNDLTSYTGHDDNNDLDTENPDSYFKGLEDDDDFEKVVIKEEIKELDLSLKKFITKKNGNTVEPSRAPIVNIKPLKDGGKNASYQLVTSPELVKQGDIIEYTIRVYNEGDYDAYAEEISDIIPEGLGVLVNHKTNVNNYWSIPKDSKSVALSTIPNAVKNVKLTDFENVTSLDDVMVTKGKVTVTSNALSHGVKSENMLSAFDANNDTNESFSSKAKDIKIVCVVLDSKVANNNFRNVAEISADAITLDGGDTIITKDDDGYPSNGDKEGDRDSTPGNASTKEGEDDDDNENLTVEEEIYDLALQKFITKVDETVIKDREPTITLDETTGNIKYSHTSDPQPVANGQLVEYTIRVYNEGKTAAYAAEIADDIPNGLEFVADNETNKKYGWYFVDKNGQKTTNPSLANTIRTDYLSKEKTEERRANATTEEGRNEDNLLQPFKDNVLDARDVKIVFKVSEAKLEETTTTDKRILKNIAEITSETDKDGEEVTDIDSTPDNWDETEDDNDNEKVYVKFFDLELTKSLVKVIVTTNGNTVEYDVEDDQLFKVEINKKNLNSTEVKFVYQINVFNKGQIEGYASEIKDYIPEGLEFIPEDNPGWYQLEDGAYGTAALADTLLEPETGSAYVNITLKWINSDGNLGRKVNIAEINADKNPYGSKDVDSTPGNKNPDEDDIDDAPVILGIATGKSTSYTGLIVAVAAIMSTGVVLIKKYVL